MTINASDYEKDKTKYNESVNKSMKIERMKQSPAGEVYKSSAYDPDKLVLMMNEGELWITLNIARGCFYNESEDIFEIDDLDAYRRSMNNAQSKWRQFVERYGLPHVGMTINLRLNKDLFYDIVLFGD